MKEFSHLVEIDAANRNLVIYRVDSKGNNVLYTSIDLPEMNLDNDLDKFKSFATLLGENLLLDSPEIRRLYNI